MKKDIFEDMAYWVDCEYISDLPYRKRKVWEVIKRQSPLAYHMEQLEKVFSLCIRHRLCCYNGNTRTDEREVIRLV
mgnify:CR=1 FL=1